MVKAASEARTTVDPAEVARFAGLADEWWNPRGKMRPLHKFNPVRLAYIRDRICERFGRDAKSLESLKGLRILEKAAKRIPQFIDQEVKREIDKI